MIDQRVLSVILKGKFFNLGVDLGCGEGTTTIREHCKTIIGVDHNLPRLSIAKEFNKYDKIVYSEIKDYEFPPNTDAVFMTELIEHLTKQDGYNLISKVSYIPYILISTPTKFWHYVFKDHHVSLWSEDELQRLGFETTTYKRFALMEAVFGEGMIAVRERKSMF